MCGIAGVVTRTQAVARRVVGAMTAAQFHRGPDDAGESVFAFGSDYLGLGHRRLSILDLSAAGHQPMINPRTGDQIIFNGEIYNFLELRRELESLGEQFIGHSDTEVLLYGLSRWGHAFLRRLAGMFALAFLNAREQTLLLARDPLGIKPLYVAQVGQTFLFASEVRAILASDLVPRRHSPQGLATLLAYGAVQHPFTIVQGIESFPAGCYQVIAASSQANRLAPQPFWQYPTEIQRHADGLEENLAATLEQAVKDHLVADVPVGVFLSSGLDSTIIAGLAARHSARLRTLTVGFSDQPDMSELKLASETAKLFGLEHTEIQVAGAEAESAAIEWIQSLDQPSVDGMNVYLISKVVRAHGISVALSGQGADELFGGYPSFADVPQLRRMVRLMRWLPAGGRVGLARLLTRRRPESVRQKFIDIMRTNGAVADLYFHRRRMLSTDQMIAMGIDAAKLGLADCFQSPRVLADLRLCDEDIVWSVSQLESRFYQGNMLLRDSDTNGMAHSLEIRVPMLDRRVLDLILPVAGPVRLPNGRADKHLLRTTFSPLLRAALLAQRKRGFGLPIRRWMAGPMRDLCENAVGRLKSADLLRPGSVDAVWQAFLRDPESPAWSRAFTLCVLGLYLQRTGLS